MGLVQNSEKCKLVCARHPADSVRKKIIEAKTPPGSMVIFNGDKLWHAVTPLGEGEERIVLTMEYVTNPEMGPLMRFVSNMKDAIAYFGVSALFGNGKTQK